MREAANVYCLPFDAEDIKFKSSFIIHDLPLCKEGAMVGMPIVIIMLTSGLQKGSLLFLQLHTEFSSIVQYNDG